MPSEYARVIKNASKVTVPVIASDITDARIGPTQGVQRSPTEKPISSPPLNPVLPWFLGIKLASLENNRSTKIWNCGIRSEIPKPATTITEAKRNVSAGMPLKRTIVERKSVKKVKLSINPDTTPIGRDFPVFTPPILEVRTIGRIGRMHGDKTVIIPAKNANAISNIIILLSKLLYKFYALR